MDPGKSPKRRKVISEELSLQYLRTFERNLRIKDRKMKEEILASVNEKISNLKGINDLGSLITEMGDPVELARDLSNPVNWVIDIGTPLDPKVPMEGYFSRKGRIMIASVFILGLVLSFLILMTLKDPAWTLSGTLIVFFAIWVIGSSLLNSYLGYLSLYQKLKGSDLKIEGLRRGDLKKQLSMAFLMISVLMVLCGVLPVVVDTPAGFLSIPLAIVTFTVSVIGIIILYMEGRRVLKP